MKRKPAKHCEPTAAELREVIPPIPDTPENVARACLRSPPKKRECYLDRVRAEKKEKRQVS